ncbi:MAG: hypothetical protein SGJ15_06360, partial [Bacteroidota bacterium]|nr:hypothetical protein [Bacteroidota bacterium]
TIVDISYLHDIVVLKLNQPIPPHFKPFYSGWTANQPSALSSPFFDIHHASSDIKKLAMLPFRFL